jgi:hypothetical protein
MEHQGSHNKIIFSRYIFAQRFKKESRLFFDFLDNYRERLKNFEDIMIPEFDDIHKLEAYEYFNRFIKEAILLKNEMSKYTNSIVEANYC